MADPKSETYSHKETVKRREAALQRMLNTPHKPQKQQSKRDVKQPPRQR